jgi:hypothetical protein
MDDERSQQCHSRDRCDGAAERQYRGKALEIAGDALTGVEIATAIGRALERSIPCVEVPDAIVRQQTDFLRLREFLMDRGGSLSAR